MESHIFGQESLRRNYGNRKSLCNAGGQKIHQRENYRCNSQSKRNPRKDKRFL